MTAPTFDQYLKTDKYDAPRGSATSRSGGSTS